jgi:3'-5' exoribonuclease
LKNIYVEQIKDRDEVDGVFLLRSLNLAVAKNGKPYLILKLIDRTGEIEGRVWDNADDLAKSFGKDDFVTLKGRASLYMGKMQVVVKQMQKVHESSVDFADFLPVSRFGLPELEARLRERISNITTGHLRALMESFLERSGFVGEYCSAPAAKSMHHVYLGGLLEHSLAVADLAENICHQYGDMNRDLLIVGALLHDVGKTRELQYRRSFEYTDTGKLLGHIILGVQMVDEQIATVKDFPESDAIHLKHLLLSHHGQYEFGSPKRPKTVEAIVLSYADDLDSKINGVRTHVAKEVHSSSSWTSYHRLYDQYFYKGEQDSMRHESEIAE